MGTNYYAYKIPTKKERTKVKAIVEKLQNEQQNLAELSDADDLHDVVRTVNDLSVELESTVEKLQPKIHLGKSSHGWQFLWQYHPKGGYDLKGKDYELKGKYYEDNLESIKKFLSQEDIRIIDEYGKKFTFEEFFKEIGWKLYKTDELYDLTSYYNHLDATGEHYHRFGESREWTSADGLRFTSDEFS